MKVTAVCTAFFLVASVTPAWALRCWACSGYTEGQCGDPFNSSFVWREDCNPANNIEQARLVCKKVVEIGRTGQTKYTRSCGQELSSGQACNDEFAQNSNVKYCSTCAQDECNNGVKTSLSFSLLLTWLAFVSKLR